MDNKYDNEQFFQEYAKMPRLAATGEWHQLKAAFSNLQGKGGLNLGCGFGWHCKFSIEKGAAPVLGMDLSRKMIQEAQRRNGDSRIEYR